MPLYSAPASAATTTPPQLNSLIADRYITTPYVSGTTGAIAANTLYFLPIFVHKGGTATRIGCRVSSAVAGNARLGLYNSSNGRPSTLLLDAGTVSTGTTGDKEITISQALSDNTWYWAALVADAGASYNLVLSIGAGNAFGGGSYGGGIRVSRAFAYAALPADESAQTLAFEGATNTVLIWVRAT